MNPKVQKGALFLILFLLVIFVPLAGFGVFLKLTGSDRSNTLDNVNHEFYFDNKLWFYQDDGTLLGTYECKTSKCGYAMNVVTDGEYGVNSIEVEENEPIKIINNRFALLTDTLDETTTEAFIYDLVNGISYQQASYFSAKDYGVGIGGNLLIVENASHQFGVIRLNDIIAPVLPIQYSFIGLTDQKDETGKLLADYLIVANENSWRLIDQNGAMLTSEIFEPIVDYTGTYLITRNEEGYYHLVDYNNNALLEEDFSNLSFTDKYVNCFTTTNEFYVYDVASQEIVSQIYPIDDRDEVLSVIDTNNNVVISINNRVVETIESD